MNNAEAELIRLLRSLARLRQPTTIRDLCALNNVSEKTARRDLDLIRSLGFRVVTTEECDVFYAHEDGFKAVKSALAFAETLEAKRKELRENGHETSS